MAATLTKERRAEVERRAWELRQRGWTEPRIAAELDVHVSTISRALQRIEAKLAREFERDAHLIKARQTAQLEHIFAEALDEWERSKQDAEGETVTSGRVHVSRDGDVTDLPDQVVRTRKGRLGDPDLLEKAMAAQDRIRQIWGLDAPKKTDVTSGGERIGAITIYIPDNGRDGDPPAAGPAGDLPLDAG